MRIIRLPVLLVFLFILGCGTTGTYERNVYRFVYDAEIYEIVSMSMAERAGYNILQFLDEDDLLILDARDSNSDGTLDTLVTGAITLERANLIYRYGIDQAIHSGKLEMRTDKRIFELARADGIYIIETVGYDDLINPRRITQGYEIIPWVRVYNEFSILDPEGETEKMIFRDSGADGLLQPQDADRVFETSPQELYRLVLDNGLEAGRIEKVNEMYVVRQMSWNPT